MQRLHCKSCVLCWGKGGGRGAIARVGGGGGRYSHVHIYNPLAVEQLAQHVLVLRAPLQEMRHVLQALR